MGGKSVLIRQAALTVIMAQVRCMAWGRAGLLCCDLLFSWRVMQPDHPPVTVWCFMRVPGCIPQQYTRLG